MSGFFAIPLVIARYEAIANYTGRTFIATLPVGDCFVPRNDGNK
jgi:hypothetical protein